jgi:hypothetical protein
VEKFSTIIQMGSVLSANLKLVDTDQGVIEAALEIAREWDKNVGRLCQAVLSGDYKTAKLLARELLNDEESDRADQGFN